MKTFIKKIEDFTCEHCGKDMKGGGYTNHCANCLWSKHVDIQPGDRLSECKGMMEPVQIEARKTDYFIVHRCVVCKKEKKNKLNPGDNFDIAVAIQKKTADIFSSGLRRGKRS